MWLNLECLWADQILDGHHKSDPPHAYWNLTLSLGLSPWSCVCGDHVVEASVRCLGPPPRTLFSVARVTDASPSTGAGNRSGCPQRGPAPSRWALCALWPVHAPWMGRRSYRWSPGDLEGGPASASSASSQPGSQPTPSRPACGRPAQSPGGADLELRSCVGQGVSSLFCEGRISQHLGFVGQNFSALSQSESSTDNVSSQQKALWMKLDFCMFTCHKCVLLWFLPQPPVLSSLCSLLRSRWLAAVAVADGLTTLLGSAATACRTFSVLISWNYYIARESVKERVKLVISFI